MSAGAKCSTLPARAETGATPAALRRLLAPGVTSALRPAPGP
jgi:hypothetical protein